MNSCAVEDGGDFALRARTDGRARDSEGRELFDKMARAAWECADPGIQYDDTINDWHTNPETGRITASNPCSEYMSLDNSSCNLASLNSAQVPRDDDTFDAKAFEQAVELIITAMDISICFADFPTKAIGVRPATTGSSASATPTWARCSWPPDMATTPRWPRPRRSPR